MEEALVELCLQMWYAKRGESPLKRQYMSGVGKRFSRGLGGQKSRMARTQHAERVNGAMHNPQYLKGPNRAQRQAMLEEAFRNTARSSEQEES